jgi:CheY-like chemotaxis protein
LHLNLQRRLPLVRVDPNHLEMALLNIVVNARDASPKGGAITVTTRVVHLNGDAAAQHLRAGEYVCLSVTDEGTGMPPHVQARATEPFFTTKGPGHGTGLGLAMAHGFVQQSGGRLEIKSEPDRGTTVHMLFPRLKAENEVAAAMSGYQARRVDGAAAPPLILVVEDSHEIADMARETLTEAGYRVVVTSNAEEAFEQFERMQAAGDPFQLVFSDVLMPGSVNGLVLAEWIRERDPTVSILLTTGYNDEMSLDGPRTSTLEVLGKPYKRSELMDRVQATLRQGVRTGPGRELSEFGHAEG